MEEVRFLAPVKNPKQDVICLGINYMDHAEESARYKKEAFGGERPYAVYFSKRVNESVANGDGIQSHSDIVTDLDYEVELAVIIGKEAKNVPEEEVKNYIFGYTIINDVSARTSDTAQPVVFWKEPGWIFPNGTMYHHSGRYPISAKAFYPVPRQWGIKTGQQYENC